MPNSVMYMFILIHRSCQSQDSLCPRKCMQSVLYLCIVETRAEFKNVMHSYVCTVLHLVCRYDLCGGCQIRMGPRHEIRDESLAVLSVNKSALAQSHETTWHLLKVLWCQVVVAEFSMDPSQVIADCSIQQDFFPELYRYASFSVTNGQDNLEKLDSRSQ